MLHRCLEAPPETERVWGGLCSLVEKPKDEGFYDRDEICNLLHIAYPTLWRIEKSGVLKSQKVGRKNLYSKQDVNLLIKSGKLAKYNRNRK